MTLSFKNAAILNIVVRYGTMKLEEYFKDSYESRYLKLAKGMVDEAANAWVYQAAKDSLPALYAQKIPTIYNNPYCKFFFTASIPILSAIYIQTFEPLINLGLMAYSDSQNAIQSFHVHLKHVFGQIPKYFYLSFYPIKTPIEIMLGGTICYAIRGAVDKLIFNYNSNYADEVISFIKESFAKLLIDKGDAFDIPKPKELMKIINDELKEARSFLISEMDSNEFNIISIQSLYEKIQSKHKSLQSDAANEIFTSAQNIAEQNIEQIAKNQQAVSSFQVSTEFLIGALNNGADLLDLIKSIIGNSAFGSMVRSTEVLVRFLRETFVTPHLRTEYNFTVEPILKKTEEINSYGVDYKTLDLIINSPSVPNSSPPTQLWEFFENQGLMLHENMIHFINSTTAY